jgi:MFS superfamily sulfate permease-like transporter
VVFFSTLLIGLDIGLGIGVLFSLFLVMFRTVLPYSPALGEARAWHYPPEVKFADEDFDVEDLRVHRVQGIYIFQFNAPLYFASAGVFRSRLYTETGINPTEEGRVKGPRGCFQQCGDQIHNRGQSTAGKRVNLEDGVKGDSEDGASDVNYNRLQEEEVEEGEEISKATGYSYHTVVLDCAPIAFIDSTGIAVLEQVVRELEGVGVQVLLANPPTPLCEALNRFGFFGRYSSERLFPSVALAVRYTRDGNRVPPLEKPSEPDLTLASNLERQLLYSNRPSLFQAKVIELEHR